MNNVLWCERQHIGIQWTVICMLVGLHVPFPTVVGILWCFDSYSKHPSIVCHLFRCQYLKWRQQTYNKYDNALDWTLTQVQLVYSLVTKYTGMVLMSFPLLWRCVCVGWWLLGGPPGRQGVQEHSGSGPPHLASTTKQNKTKHQQWLITNYFFYL